MEQEINLWTIIPNDVGISGLIPAQLLMVQLLELVLELTNLRSHAQQASRVLTYSTLTKKSLCLSRPEDSQGNNLLMIPLLL